MDLRTFYQQQSADDREAFASRIETSPLYYRNIAYGFRRPNPTLALAIERESGGKVLVSSMRPDVADALTASGYHKTRRRSA